MWKWGKLSCSLILQFLCVSSYFQLVKYRKELETKSTINNRHNAIILMNWPCENNSSIIVCLLPNGYLKLHLPWHYVEVSSRAEVTVDKLRQAEDEDADGDVDQVEDGQTKHQRVKVALDLDAFPKHGDRLNSEWTFDIRIK